MKKKTTDSSGRFVSTKEWRDLFHPDILNKGNQLKNKKCVKQFTSDETSAGAFIIDGTKAYKTAVISAPTSYTDKWDEKNFSCNCKTIRNKRTWDWQTGKTYYTCEHEAALMLHWEEEHGIWQFTENDEEYKKRLAKEDLSRRKELLAKQKKAETKIELPAAEFFKNTPSGGFFDVTKAVQSLKTTRFALNRAQDLMKNGKFQLAEHDIFFGSNGGQILQATAKIGDELSSDETRIALGFDGLENRFCTCTYQSYYYFGVRSTLPLCEHELLLLKKMQEIARESNLGDATDATALRFFSAMSEPSRHTQTETEEQQTKQAVLVLSPRVVIDGGEVSLSFKLGRVQANDTSPSAAKSKAAKSNVIKNLKTFVQAAAEETEFELTRTQTIDFSREDFTEESLPWLTFIQRRVSESQEVNSRLQSRAFYGYNPSLKMQDSLTGAMLDQFYEIAEGQSLESINRAKNNETGILKVGHADMRVRLNSEKITDQNGTFFGVQVTGTMPVILPGSSGSYILSEGKLSRITKEEENVLQPFLEASDEEGNISFRVGKNSLAEFYYRIVPEFLQSRYIDFSDNCEQDAEASLPPEPEFLFRLDFDETAVFCDAFVTYNKISYNLYDDVNEKDGYRDKLQEDRVRNLLLDYFQYVDPNERFVWADLTDDKLYTLLTEAVPKLSRYGEVLGSEEFNRLKIRTSPSIQVGVSIQSGIMDLSIISKDLSPEELLEILGSYREKKKYHRLKSGDYIRIAQNDQLGSLDSMLKEINVKAEDVVGKEAHLPLYRALYLDAMLKKHEELSSNRDRTYRALLKNFVSIRDADYETPAAQADILRNYQVYGFKWLRTLAGAGFGGILADEMGLGKTIQAITLLQSLKDEGEQGVSLIVCPASLVYNWQEEFRRFAPGLTVEPVAGTAGVRKNQLSKLSQGENTEKPDVLITSYDLFRKDIMLYENIQFNAMFLDEAQYIKNQKAAVTKAVKTARARYRFALTGTPVENRLAELWSIFDFLMPGFLYSSQEFSQRFETPIVKNKDEELSRQLRQMTSPFILRRLKQDVLKDLPEKLEEVRYTRFEDDQRKIYDGQVVHMKQMLSGLGSTGEDKLKVLTELMRIRQICCDPSLLFEDYHGGSAKREACLELIQSAIGGGHRMLVFSQFTSMLALLEEDLKREGIAYFKLTGATPKEQRIRMVRDFNEGDTPVFLISLKAGGTGLNLTGADVVIHYDPWWNVAAQNQATDRAHRIGQVNTVTVYRLIVKDTIEEKILALQEAKHDLAESILSGESNAITTMSTEELMALLG